MAANARPMASTSASRTPVTSLLNQRLDLAEGLLYEIQLCRVGRQEQKLCPSCFDELSYPL